MSTPTRQRVLLVRAWTHEVGPIVAQLRDAGLDPEITRVDFEAALHAALSEEPFDIVVHDDAALTRDAIDGALRERPPVPPVVAIEPLATLGERVVRELRERRN